MSTTTSEPKCINGATLHKSSHTCFEQTFCDFFQNYVGGIFVYITQRNLNSSAQQNRFNNARFKRKIQLFFIAFCRVHLGPFGFKDVPEGLVYYPLRISTVDYHGGRIAFHFSWLTPSKKKKKWKYWAPTCHFCFEADVDTIQHRSRTWPWNAP